MILPKEYIGDGVYAEHDGFGMTVTTEDGIRVTNTIYFEPSTWSALADYVERIKNRPQ